MPKKERLAELSRLEKNIGNIIKEVLNEKDLSIKDFWANAWEHYDYNGVTKRLSGDVSLTILDIKKASKYLGVSTDYLLGLTKEQNPADQKEAAADPVTPHKLCETLVSILDSAFPWELKLIPYSELTLTEDGTEKEETFIYPAIIFREFEGSSYKSYTDERGMERVIIKSKINENAASINTFIKKAAKYHAWLKDNEMDISKEEYNDFIEKQLSKVTN